MDTMELLTKHTGDFIFITPVGNLRLTDAVHQEFAVNRVVFVSKEKLWRIRKRLGIDISWAEIRKAKLEKDFFESAETYAVVRHKGNQAETTKLALKLVRDELSILSLSQLGYTKRRSTGHIALLGEHGQTSVQYFFFKKDETWKGHGWRLTSYCRESGHVRN
ncbi:MAG: hypothetical protein ACT4QE_12255 [Anaerolineales bacterium]